MPQRTAINPNVSVPETVENGRAVTRRAGERGFSRFGSRDVSRYPLDEEMRLVATDSGNNPGASPEWFVDLVFDRPMDQAYTYAVPASLTDRVAVGQRVVAPFGRGDRLEIGIAVHVHQQVPRIAPKTIHSLLDDQPLVPESLLRLTRWLADYYLSSWGQALFAAIPTAVRQDVGVRETIWVEAIPSDELPKKPISLTAKQIAALKYLRAHGPLELRELARQVGCGVGPIQAVVAKGFARKQRQRIDPFVMPALDGPDPEPISLSDDQKRAWDEMAPFLEEPRFQAILLHGVTGSGKTELYLQAIERIARNGRQALVLVPEISLTPQTIDRFRGRCRTVAALHSHLREVDRAGYWRQIAQGNVDVVVGARSAVFAPLPRLGLIVVDEEHEQSFKQESVPRYQGRDVAVMRARLENVPIVLGSATPSLETWLNAQRGLYRLLSLPNRVLDRPLPRVEIIDLRTDGPRQRSDSLSPRLEEALGETLTQGGQAILLLNRRGYSTHLVCPKCGSVALCDRCDVTLTYHKQRQSLMCHYCGFVRPVSPACSLCGHQPMRFVGMGTEKLQAELERKFPQRVIRRMDTDTMQRPGSHRQVLDEFRAGAIDILMGTQMIAKGLDFPNVTLVGVVNADVGLHIPDFRAAERTFQLLAQVAGRTGRGSRGGRVLIQTFTPEHPSIVSAARHDYLTFARQELEYRRQHGYPPYQRLARVILRSRKAETAESCAHQWAGAFQSALRRHPEHARTIRLLGPAECPVFRLNNYFRYHFQLQALSSGTLHEVLRDVLATVSIPHGVEYQVDIDPYQMM
jgi:primosomal protein N' (replication factor Y)